VSRRRGGGFGRRRTWAIAAGAALATATGARAQEFPTVFRGDEVGPRELQLDEETFLNILSFERPLETVQPFLAADNGWYVTLGSLRSDILWYRQDMKILAPISETLDARAAMRNGVDFDTDHTQVQVTPELKISEHWVFGIPAVLAFDKGSIHGGFHFTYRDPAHNVDFVRLQWVRSHIVFDERSDQFPQSEIKRPADNFELQYQADLFDFGKTTIIVADQVPSRIDFVETEHIEEFSRISARLLQAHDFSPTQRMFADFQFELASERSVPTGPLGVPDQYEGDRDYFLSRLEYQQDLDPEHVRRVRSGVQYVYFREDAEEPNVTPDPVNNVELQRATMLYAGYRSPLMDSKEVDLETTVYVSAQHGVSRDRTTPDRSDTFPRFQAKVNFSFRWHVADRAEFVLTPSFELDQIGWGGGGIMLRYVL
jgi:hypothetical protein